MSADEIRKVLEQENIAAAFNQLFDQWIEAYDRLAVKKLGKCDCGRDAVKRCQDEGCRRPICEFCSYSISGDTQKNDCGECYDRALSEWYLAQMGGRPDAR